MSEPIKVGDLVQIVRTSGCGCANTLGTIFTVGEILASCGGCCGACWANIPPSPAVIDHADGMRCEMSRLKRIPPLTELEGQRTQEDIREPA